MKIAFMGGCGFIGSHFVDKLREEGFDVAAIGRCTHHKDETILCDIRDAASVRKAVEGCGAIIHFAALINVDHSIKSPRPFFETNVFGTFNVLEAAREINAHVFYKSTCEVFGNIPYPDFADEEYRQAPHSPYAASKMAAERYCLAYSCTYGLDLVVSRTFNTYGPRQSAKAHGAVIPKFIVSVLSGGAPRVFGDGSQSRDYVYVEDVVNADLLLFKNMIDRKSAPGEVYNICTGKDQKIIDIANRVIELSGKQGHVNPEPAAERKGEVKRLAGNNEKMRKLGWKPQVSFEEGLERTIEWFRSHNTS